MIAWHEVFPNGRTASPATNAEITALVKGLGQPLSAAELAAVNRTNTNPFARTDPLYATWQPFNARAWVMPQRPLPESFLSFLRFSNGGTYTQGQRLFQMFGTGLRNMMLSYNLPQYMPLAVPFAFNGGGVFYFFDMREPAVDGEYPIIVAHAGNLTFNPYDSPRVATSFLGVCQGRFNVERLRHDGVVLNEQTWETCTDPGPMLDDCDAHKEALRLFAVACCRRVAHLLPDKCFHHALTVAEQFAAGTATAKKLATNQRCCADYPLDELPTPTQAACRAVINAVDEDADEGAWNSAWAAALADSDGLHESPAWQAARARQADLLRELVGNPHRPLQVEPAWLRHNGGVVRDLVRAAYEDRRYDVLPILADALEEAGCTDTAILDHCRGPGPHVHGCWVLTALRAADKRRS